MSSIEVFKVRCKGVKPLLMANPQMANPLNHYAKELKKYSSKRNKTEDDYIEISKIQFLGACYWDNEIGFFIPSENIEACIIAGAKVTKNGKKIPLAVNVIEYKIPLIHKSGATTPEELFNDDDFKDVRFVNVNRAKVLRTRPRFDQWEIEFTVELDTTLLDPADFIEALNNAGQRAGLGDFRPKYGCFEALPVQIE